MLENIKKMNCVIIACELITWKPKYELKINEKTQFYHFEYNCSLINRRKGLLMLELLNQ